MGLLTTGGLSNVSNGCPKHIRPILDSAFLAMAMANGFTFSNNKSVRRIFNANYKILRYNK